MVNKRFVMYKRMSDSAVRRLLFNAVQRDDAAEAEDIISEVTDMHQKAFALATCVAQNNIKLLRVFMKHGCDPLLKYQGISALARSVQCNNHQVLRIILEDYLPLTKYPSGSRTHYRVRRALDEAIFEAASFCSVSCMEYLLDAGANCNVYSYHDDEFLSWCPPVIAACYAPVCKRASHDDVNGAVRALIKYGCDINKENHMNDTALHWACGVALVDVVRLLIRHGAEVNHRNSIGKTPLMVLGELSDGGRDLESYLMTAKILISHGADLNQTDISGWTPLHFAVHQSFPALVCLLLESGAKTEPVGTGSLPAIPPVSCLSLALQLQNPEIVQILLEWNTDVDLPMAEISINNIYENLAIAVMLYNTGARCISDNIDDVVLQSLCSHVQSNIEYIKSLAHPRTLRSMCKICVRKHLGKRLVSDLSLLPLPSSLIGYISSVM